MTGKDRYLNILLVEDNPVDILVTTEALKLWKTKHRLYVVEDGQSALDILYGRGDYAGAEKPDLILLDLNLPLKSGREILSEIKQHSDLSDISVVVVTTSSAAADTQACIDLGAELCITKPVDFAEYIQAITSIEEYCLSPVG